MNVEAPVKILIVDDTPQIAKVLEKQIKRNYGASVESRVAISATEALSFLSEQPDTNILITDLKMPQTDGIALLRKARMAYPDAQRILLSGYADIENLTDAVNDCGIKGFITKPIKIAQVFVVMDSAIKEIRLKRENRLLQEANKKSFLEVLSLVYDIMAELSPEIFEYSIRTAETAGRTARSMGLADEKISVLITAAKLHAVSMLGLDSKIYKTHPSNLPGDFKNIYSKYPDLTLEMLKSTPRLREERGLIRLHQENIDGSGPLGLKGDEIPLEARILRLCSYYCASVYLRSGDRKLTMSEINVKSGKLFDSQCVQYFLKELSMEMGAVTYPVLVKDLRAGMVLGEDILSKTGGTLLPEGTMLNNINLKRLKIYNEFNPLGEIFVIIQGGDGKPAAPPESASP